MVKAGVTAGVTTGVRPGPQVYVQTRGTARAADYAFLCGAPPHAWWRAYRDATAFDHPTVLVVSDGGGWSAYLSGIPSARVDAVGTVVRYTLVLDGPCGNGPVAAQLPAAVAAWLDDIAQAPTGRLGRRLSAALDARLPPDDVQRWIDADAPSPLPPACGSSAISEPGRRVLDALATLAAPDPAAPDPAAPDPAAPDPGTGGRPGDWVGGVGSAAARGAFLARVTELVGGTAGRALLLNLVGPDEVAALLAPDSPVAVLVDGAVAVTPPRGEVDAKKAPALPRRAGVAAVTGAAMLPVMAAAVVLTALVVTALVVMALVLLL